MVTEKLPTSIRKAVVDFGPKILNEAKLTNILLDYGAFTEVPSAKIVIKELVAESWCAKILEAQDDDNKIQSLISVISDKMGFKTDVVEYTVLSVVYSISKNKSLPQYNKVEEQTTSIPISSPITSQKLDGEYSEKLRTGGDLKVTANSWKISYYFPGPDGRYNGTFVYVNDKDIDAYIAAWKSNFAKFQQLKTLLPQGGNSDYPGDMGMSIRFGYFEGVCIRSYHLPINTQEKLDAITNEYEMAKLKAAQIQKILNGNI